MTTRDDTHVDQAIDPADELAELRASDADNPNGTRSAPTQSPGARVLEILELITPPEGDFTISEVSEKTLAWLEENDPALLAIWLREIGLQTLHEFLRHKLLKKRAQWSRSTRQRAFKEAATTAEETGDFSGLETFSLTYSVNAENLRRRVAEMTKADHEFVASQYEETANRMKLMAAFHRAIAKRIGPGQTTADVMDEETYTRVYTSMIGPQA